MPFASIPGPPPFSGTLTTTVLAGDATNPLGGLTFTYLLTNDPGSTTSLGKITNVDFSGFLTDVSFVAGPGIAPSIVERSTAPGGVIGWSFISAPLGLGNVPPGASSVLMVVQTDAPAFVPTTASVIDGSIAIVPSFGPAVPEPGAISVLLLATLPLMRRRSNA